MENEFEKLLKRRTEIRKRHLEWLLKQYRQDQHIYWETAIEREKSIVEILEELWEVYKKETEAKNEN